MAPVEFQIQELLLLVKITIMLCGGSFTLVIALWGAAIRVHFQMRKAFRKRDKQMSNLRDIVDSLERDIQDMLTAKKYKKRKKK